MHPSIEKGDDFLKDEDSEYKTHGIHFGIHGNKIEIHGNEQLRDLIMYLLDVAMEDENIQEILKKSEEESCFSFNNK